MESSLRALNGQSIITTEASAATGRGDSRLAMRLEEIKSHFGARANMIGRNPISHLTKKQTVLDK